MSSILEKILPHIARFAPPSCDRRDMDFPGGGRKVEEPQFDSVVTEDGRSVTETEKYIFTVTPGTEDTGGTLSVFNKATGTKQEEIWGDPHTMRNGDFHGPMTMLLDDGTKVTCSTEQFKNTDKTLLSGVTITNGKKGVQVNDCSDGKLTGFKMRGEVLDNLVEDGNTVYSTSKGLRGLRGEVVDQQYMDSHDTDLNPWLRGRDDVEWGSNNSREKPARHENGRTSGFERNQSRSEEKLYDALNTLMSHLQGSFGVKKLQMEGMFSRLADELGAKCLKYDDSVGWSIASLAKQQFSKIHLF